VWNGGLAKDTAIWFVLSGLALLLNPRSGKADERFFRRAVVAAVGITALLELYGNLVVFPLWIELTLQPTLLFLMLMGTFAGQKPEYAPVKRLFDGVSATVTLIVPVVVSVDLVRGWNTFDKAEMARSLALPIWLTIGSFPRSTSSASITATSGLFARLGAYPGTDGQCGGCSCR
jgi:hypothetical protein